MTKVFRNVVIGVVVGLLLGCTSVLPKQSDTTPMHETPTESKSCADIHQGAIPSFRDTLPGVAGDGQSQRSIIVIGVIIAGIAGLTMRNLVIKRQEEYANREAAILTECEIVKRQIDTLMTENWQLQQDISAYKQQIAALAGNKVLLRKKLETVKTRYKSAKRKLAKAETDLADARAQYDRQMKASTKDDAEMKKWKTQVAQLEKEKRMLESNVRTLFSMTLAF